MHGPIQKRLKDYMQEKRKIERRNCAYDKSLKRFLSMVLCCCCDRDVVYFFAYKGAYGMEESKGVRMYICLKCVANLGHLP